MILVLNEWIFHDLFCDNGPEKFRETAEFVIRLDRSSDIVVIPAQERWRSKANQLWGMASPIQREVGRLLLYLFSDSTRCIRLEPGDIPATSQGSYDWAPSEDVYLVEACVVSGADLLVTTDETLFDAVTEHDTVECMMRQTFSLDMLPPPPLEQLAALIHTASPLLTPPRQPR